MEREVKFVRAVTTAAALGALAFGGMPARAITDVPSLPRCPVADARLITRLDSAVNTAGDAFTFAIVEHVDAREGLPEIVPGTKGFGVVAFADHAHGAGTPGKLVVEPRFIKLADGTHLPVMADPQLGENFAEGSTRNVPGALELVPGIGLAVTGYNALHRGKEVVLPKGMPFRVVLGDELASATCFVPPPDALNVR
ncbi:MAG: hypothetical protein IAI49_13510 [Candidatus Eremiobacteraeota bacterium]|nr:hypothetical protein [Candidatus Eremiobacteraeota bacterium]